MKRRLLAAVLPALLVAVVAGAQQVQVREEMLPNGMRFLLVERHDAPTVSCGFVAKVGSVNEPQGLTGITHLLEHMMFKGTRTIGTSDWARNEAIITQQDEVRAEMDKEYTELRTKLRRGEISGSIYDAANATPRLKELKEQYEKLVAAEKDVVVKDELDQIYTQQGASGLNAGTSEDQTFYFITLPTNKLELWFWMESDRLSNAVMREFYSERDVVREERRLAVDSTPTGLQEEAFDAMFWQSSPYSHPVIGLALRHRVGDPGSRPSATSPPTTPPTTSPRCWSATSRRTRPWSWRAGTSAASRGARWRRPRWSPPSRSRSPRSAWPPRPRPTPRSRSASTPWRSTTRTGSPSTCCRACSTAAPAGSTRRWWRRRSWPSAEPDGSARDMKYEGYFELSAEVKDGVDPRAVEDALMAELDRLAKEPVGERELKKVKNQMLADSYRRLQSNFFLLLQLLLYDSWGDWQYLNDSPAKLQAVTAEDVQRVVKTYLTADKKNVLVFTRKAGSAPEDPEIAALPAQMKSMVQQQAAGIAEMTDKKELEQMLGQYQQGAGQAPPQVRPALNILIKKIQARLEALGSASQGGEKPPVQPQGGKEN